MDFLSKKFEENSLALIAAGKDYDGAKDTERTDGVIPARAPRSKKEWLSMFRMTSPELLALGLRPWSEGEDLWLLPHEWYYSIPHDFPTMSINNVLRHFCPKVLSAHYYEGVLGYGMLIDAEENDRLHTQKKAGAQ